MAREKRILTGAFRLCNAFFQHLSNWRLRKLNFKQVLAFIDFKFERFRSVTSENMKILSWRTSNLKQLIDNFERRLSNLERANQPEDLTTNESNRPQRGSVSPQVGISSPAFNTRSRDSTTLETSVSDVKNPRVVFSLRHGENGAVAKKTFYFRCDLCNFEEFSEKCNDADLCSDCKPSGSGQKTKFYKIVDLDRKMFWFCSCQFCASGKRNFCQLKTCDECSKFRYIGRNSTNV